MKNFDLALDEFRKFQKNYPDSPEAPDNLLDWGGTLIELGARGDAAATLDRLVTRYPASDAATQGSLWLGDLYVGRGEWDKAQDVLGSLAKRKDARPDRRATAWFALARIHEAQTNVAAAIDALEQGTKIAPDPAMKVQGDAYRAKLLIRSGKVDEGVGAIPSGRQGHAVGDALGERPARPGRRSCSTKGFTKRPRWNFRIISRRFPTRKASRAPSWAKAGACGA